MRAGGVTLLLGLALIHVSLAGNSTNDAEEEPTALADGVFFKNGYVFDNDKIFAEKANSILKYSAEVMKDSTTEKGRYYTYCIKVGHDIVCLDVRLTNSTNFSEEIAQPIAMESGKVFQDGYIFYKDETFAEKVRSLLEHILQVMKECTTKDCRSYTYCIKVGDDIVCLSITLNKSVVPLNEEDSAEGPSFFHHGSIFDGDKIFSKKSESLLNYSFDAMRTCTTMDSPFYTVCRKMGYDVVCLTVWLSSEDHILDDLNVFSSFFIDDDELNFVEEIDNEELLHVELEDNDELLEGQDSSDDLQLQSEENEEDEKEKQKDDFLEDKVEDTPLA